MSTCPMHECLCRLEPQVMHTLLEWQQKITVAFNYISLPSGGRAYKQLTRSGLVCSVEIILITRPLYIWTDKTQINCFLFLLQSWIFIQIIYESQVAWNWTVCLFKIKIWYMFLWAVCMSAIKVMLHQSDQNVPIEMSYGNISEKYLDMHYKVYVSLTVATNLTWTMLF